MPDGQKISQLKATQQQIPYNAIRLVQYSEDEIDHCERSLVMRKYIEEKTIQSENTGITYKTRMQAFSQFIFQKYEKLEVDDLLNQVKAGKLDAYDVLTKFSGFLKERKGLSGNPLSANFRIASVKTIRKFMRVALRINVTSEDFKELVPLPRKERPDKQAMEKKDVVRYLNACKNMQLKTALHVFACTGSRPIEPCAVRERDIDLDANPPTITYQAEYSKMRVARKRPLTQEAANQLRLWLNYKYRTRRTTVKDEKTDTYVKGIVTPKREPNNLLLSMPHLNGQKPTPNGLYDNLSEAFAELVDMVDGKGSRRTGERRPITLKTFRDFVKSTIADLGYSDYSEWTIGHSGSSYYQKSEKEKYELWRKIEGYLTYLDISSMEAKGADMQSRIEALQHENLDLKRNLDQTIERKVQEILNRVDVKRLHP